MQMPNFTRNNIINSLQRIEQMDPVDINPPTKFELLYQGKRYPPKEVLRYANLDLNGRFLEGHGGGDETNDVLIKLGFTVVLLGTNIAIGLRYTAKKRKGIIDEYELFDLNRTFIEDVAEEILSHTDREMLTKARIGQSVFKKGLLKQNSCCALCGVTFEPFLIASHIKPWKDAANHERLDLNNGLLLCPNHDAMFDKGYITFMDNGSMLISKLLDETTRVLMNLHEDMKIKVNDQQSQYMTWHREYCFKDNV
ncbi:HNH endonuclease [Paenibacillus sp. tmac-D7]|uniref:HNH endonuclease n=1 Tax=Paenibacillus sp. tmac-D7 TaxID=2591462 RepID=UPI0015E85417|nr:HNH endonuclease [Paenibacillus sp. tmac-D7]